VAWTQSGDGLDPVGHGVLIPFVEPRGLVKLLVGERIGIRNRVIARRIMRPLHEFPKLCVIHCEIPSS
jgi:hypothetical protein